MPQRPRQFGAVRDQNPLNLNLATSRSPLDIVRRGAQTFQDTSRDIGEMLFRRREQSPRTGSPGVLPVATDFARGVARLPFEFGTAAATLPMNPDRRLGVEWQPGILSPLIGPEPVRPIDALDAETGQLAQQFVQQQTGSGPLGDIAGLGTVGLLGALNVPTGGRAGAVGRRALRDIAGLSGDEARRAISRQQLPIFQSRLREITANQPTLPMAEARRQALSEAREANPLFGALSRARQEVDARPTSPLRTPRTVDTLERSNVPEEVIEQVMVNPRVQRTLTTDIDSIARSIDDPVAEVGRLNIPMLGEVAEAEMMKFRAIQKRLEDMLRTSDDPAISNAYERLIETASGNATHAGLSLRVWRDMMQGPVGPLANARAIVNRANRQIPNADIKIPKATEKRLLDLGKELDAIDPRDQLARGEVIGRIDDITTRLVPQRWRDIIPGIFKSNILSGSGVFLTNLLGDIGRTGSDLVEAPIRSAIGQVLRPLSGGVSPMAGRVTDRGAVRDVTARAIQQQMSDIRTGRRSFNTKTMGKEGTRIVYEADAPIARKVVTGYVDGMQRVTNFMTATGDNPRFAGRREVEFQKIEDLARRLGDDPTNPELKKQLAAYADEYAKKMAWLGDTPTVQLMQGFRDLLYTTFRGTRGEATGKVAGEILNPIIRVPANILHEVAFEYSLLGYVNAMITMVGAMKQPQGINRALGLRTGTRKLSKAMTGSIVFPTLGSWMHKAGILTSSDDEQSRTGRASDFQAGLPELGLNMSAAIRVMNGEPNDGWQPGDTVMNLAYFQPAASLVLSGVVWNQITKDIPNEDLRGVSGQISRLAKWAEGTGRANVKMLTDLPAFTAIKNLFQGDLVDNFIAIMGNVATGFLTPGIMADLARLTDEYHRETGDGKTYATIMNRLASRTPGLRQQLPVQYNTMGEPLTVAETSGVGDIPGRLFGQRVPRVTEGGPLMERMTQIANDYDMPGLKPRKVDRKGSVLGMRYTMSASEVAENTRVWNELRLRLWNEIVVDDRSNDPERTVLNRYQRAVDEAHRAMKFRALLNNQGIETPPMSISALLQAYDDIIAQREPDGTRVWDRLDANQKRRMLEQAATFWAEQGR